MKINKKPLALGIAAVLASGAVYAAVQITVNAPIAISDNTLGDKPKIQRAGDGTLVLAYGDNTPGAGTVYDVKSRVERQARDIFVKTCKPDATKTCDKPEEWSQAVNVSQSALKSSITPDWRGILGEPSPYAGDIDKPNIKTSGPMMVLTWVSKYCPDGKLGNEGIQAPEQRAVRYLELEERVIPFSCTWTAYSTNKGASWSAPIQLSAGERDAIQDASAGSISTDTASLSFNKGQVGISWQEDPLGLQLGESDGPGDGASGANSSNGTDVWYTYATVDLSDNTTDPATKLNDFVLASSAVRLSDNYTNDGVGGTGVAVPIFGNDGVQLLSSQIENGIASAARPNIGMVGATTIIAYEETKGSQGLAEGKFVRYNAFKFDTPYQQSVVIGERTVDLGSPGCIISDPNKNARRVRFLTQTPADAGSNGMQLAIFWKEGLFDKGGPSDIVVRTALGGLQPSNMRPTVDAACVTSDFAAAKGLNSARAQNISSNAPSATNSNLDDDTELNSTENALAHRGVLRGNELWLGYSYTGDLVKLWAQLDNYNFWLRKYTFSPATSSGTWSNPVNVSNITDKNINVREPRIFSTPKSNTATCPTGIPADPTTTNAADCQDTKVVYLAWGTQQNVSPFEPEGGDDLGIFITASLDGGNKFVTPVRYSTAKGSLFQDEESAYEAQVVTRPDGLRFYGAWNQANAATNVTKAQYGSGSVAVVPDPEPPVTGNGGCAYNPDAAFDPALPALLAAALAALGLRRRKDRAN